MDKEMEKEIERLKQEKIAEIKQLEAELLEIRKQDNSILETKNIQELENIISNKQHLIYSQNKKNTELRDKLYQLNSQSSSLDNDYQRIKETNDKS